MRDVLNNVTYKKHRGFCWMFLQIPAGFLIREIRCLLPGRNQDLARKMGVKKRRRKGRSARGSYCWWLKSCTTWDVWNPINNGIIIILGGAGFQPSTVSLLNLVTQGVTLNRPFQPTGFFFRNFWRYTPAQKGVGIHFCVKGCFLKDMTYSWIL